MIQYNRKEGTIMNKKMSPKDLQGLLHMRRRAYVKKNKKGKGSYNRKKLPKEVD